MSKGFKKVIIDKPASPEETAKVFKMSKERVEYIKKLVDKIMKSV